MAAPLTALVGRGMVADAELPSLTDAGRAVMEKLTAARRAAMADLLSRWAPEQHAEVRAMLDRLARASMTEPPLPAA
ncbi:hypothetical protein SAMN05216548_104224 [Faunimonas pinastri]|uniref:HTH marR-type domain-containing protein n=1 Tax=Faunimonas pinastri TaxID=1855383 RepID=A0A1H9FVG4_9HYPH|nr:hypothetical protein [Faunimonas pinastri]SEQ41920.1 hypothetical protein SAMN05216548_104224 [Faunimonas pinastri]